MLPRDRTETTTTEMQFTIDAILGNTPSSGPPKTEAATATKLPLEEGQDSGRESVCSEVPESPGGGKAQGRMVGSECGFGEKWWKGGEEFHPKTSL